MIAPRRASALCCFVFLLTVRPAAAQTGARIEQVAWLAGCWEQRLSKRTVSEQWMAPAGRSMLEMGRTVRGDSVVDYELVLLHERDGRLVYFAHPQGQAETEFISTAVADTMVMFENPQHDFPQRVGYRRRGADSLLAEVGGLDRGEQRTIVFAYRRVPCGGT